jgi:hypothetical protein
MTADRTKHDYSLAQLEDVGADILAELARDRMHDTVSALREKIVAAMDASAKAEAASNQSTRTTRRPARSWRMKAEELHTVADQTTNLKAKEALRYLARSYERLADRIDAGENGKLEKRSSQSRSVG